MQRAHLHPFRLGTSSYIIPADIIPNVQFLAGRVEDIEVVLFESDEFSNLPSPGDIARLRALAEEHHLTYSIHLPLDVYLGHTEKGERERSVGKCLRIVELTRTLPVSAFVLHGEAGHGVDVKGFDADGLGRFRDAFADSLGMLLGAADARPEEFALETLGYPFEHLWPVADAAALSVTLDVGHLELYGYDVDAHLQRYLKRTRVLHMHGIKDGRDHKDLTHMRSSTLEKVLCALRDAPDPTRVFTMEIFSREDFEASLTALDAFSHLFTPDCQNR